jgi:hypothetical protein
MKKQLTKNKKALSSLAIILLLLIAAIIGGLISYLWVMGYYISLKEKLPTGSSAAITNLSFNPQNASAFNVTILNPSFSQDPEIKVQQIGLSANTSGAEGAISFVQFSSPTLPFYISRGTSQTFTCGKDWTQYVNRTVYVSVLVSNGSGSATPIRIPYTELSVDAVNFNASIGISNFTMTLQNKPLSATYVNVTEITLGSQTINSTLVKPAGLPSLAPNTTKVLTINLNWSAYATNSLYQVQVKTRQGYAALFDARPPQVALPVQAINFSPSDTTHFNVTVKSRITQNAFLNVTKIEVLLENNSIKNVTPALSSSTNGVLANETKTFTCNWDWTNYRNKNVILTVYTLQGIKSNGQQRTPLTVLLSITEDPVFSDSQHFLLTVNNSKYSTKPANITSIQVQLENGTITTISTINPPLAYSLGIGNTTMFSCSWNWANHLNESVNVLTYTSDGYASFRSVKTPASTSNYQVYLSIPWANFTAADTTHFSLNVTNSVSSNRNANVTRITVLLENGPEIDATFTPQVVPIGSTTAFTCGWDWTTYRNKNAIIRVYTNEGLRAFYITKTPS